MILRLSESAKHDLQSISRYTRKTWDVEQETNYLNAIYDRFEQIQADPDRWRRRDELFPGSQSAPVGKHIIFFKTHPDGIQVARILHQQMDFVRHLEADDFAG